MSANISASWRRTLLALLLGAGLTAAPDGQTQQTRAKPSASAVERHFNDNNGSLPVDPAFDAPAGALCGNGASFYWTVEPLRKPIPRDWRPPPLPGSDPDYLGPAPDAEFKESPYAMPSSRSVLARRPLREYEEADLATQLNRAATLDDGAPAGAIGVLSERDAGATFAALAPRLRTLDKTLFATDDDETAARALLAQGVGMVLVDRTAPAVAPWLEQNIASLRLRLRDGVSTAWFHPRVIGSGWALYRIAAPFRLDADARAALTARARATLEQRADVGEAPQLDLPRAALGTDQFSVIVSLRSRALPGIKGRKLIKRIGRGADAVKALDRALTRLQRDWPARRVALLASQSLALTGSALPADLDDAVRLMEIELDLLFNTATLTDRRANRLHDLIELGLEGVMLSDKDARFGRPRFYLEPSYAVHYANRSPVIFLESLLKLNGVDELLREAKKLKNRRTRGRVLYEKRWREDSAYLFGRFRTLNWIEAAPGGAVVELYRGVPLKRLADVSRDSLIRSLELGARWLVAHQSQDGQYAYKYSPTAKPERRWTPGGNIVRHALNPYTLLMVNKLSPDPELVASARRGIDFSLKFLRTRGERCVICHRDPPARFYNAKIGAVAVTVLSIIKLAEVENIDDYDAALRCLGEEMLYMQDPNGHFWQYDVPPEHPYYGAENTIAPGEFIFALARLYSHYGDEKYRESVDRALPWYMAAWRQLRDQRTAEGIYDEQNRVNLVGIVPWLVTAMQDLYRQTGERRYVDIAFEMQDWIDQEFLWDAARAPYPDYLGASFKTHYELPAINSCQYSEGAAAAFDLAKRVGENVERRREVLIFGMRFCLQLQFDGPESTFFLPDPDAALGGYRYTLGHLRLRNDYSYHAMAAIAQAAEYLAADDYPGATTFELPPVLERLMR